jgi:hypothetical protein
MADGKHQTNILDLHVSNESTTTLSENIDTTFKNFGLVDLDEINIT